MAEEKTDAEKKPEKIEKTDKKKKGESKLVPARKHETGAVHMALRVALGSAGLCLVVGFVFPWLKLGEAQLSGYELVFGSDMLIRQAIGNARWILLFVPLLGLAMTAVGFLGFKWSGAIGLGISVLIIGYGIFTVVYLFFQVTGYGLWIVLAGSFTALIVGMISILRARRSKADDDADPEPVPETPSPPPEKNAEAA